MKSGDKKRRTENWLAAPQEEFGQVLAGKLQELTSTATAAGANTHYNNVRIAYTHLYGFDVEGRGANAAMVTRSGEQGEIAELRIPITAGFLEKAWNIVVGPELTWSAVPSTTDFASEADAVTARNGLQYYWEHEGVGANAKAAAFHAMAFAECAMHIPWDPTKGEAVGVDQTNPQKTKLLKSGDIAYRAVDTWNIIRDPTAKSFDASPWIIVREWHNRYDMAAQVDDEDKKEACLSAPTWIPSESWVPFISSYSVDTDLIPVYFLYCKPTPSLEEAGFIGRESVFLENGTTLRDGPLSEAYWECLPVVRMAAGSYRGTPWPYSKYFAVCGVQQAGDGLARDLLTNATAVSGPVISVEDDNVDGAVQVSSSGGPKVVTRPKGSEAPVVLQLQTSMPDHFKLRQTLNNDAQQILGIDNITAGQDVGANLSGAAMALLTSTSVQNNSQLQYAWTRFVQAIGNVTLKHIQHHMKVPKKIALAGNSRSGLVSVGELSGASVQGIQRVMVTIGSALQQTDAGKYEIATTALKEGWAKTPEQFQTVLDTGRLDALTEDLSNELLLIKQENEAIGKGENPPVMLADDHALHLKSHRFVSANLQARGNPKAIEAQQAHEDWHIRMLRETDPEILKLFGQPAMQQGGGAPPPGGPSGGPPPPGGPAGGPQAPQQQAQSAGPSMPTNPLTKEKAGPVAGTPSPALALKV